MQILFQFFPAVKGNIFFFKFLHFELYSDVHEVTIYIELFVNDNSNIIDSLTLAPFFMFNWTDKGV